MKNYLKNIKRTNMMYKVRVVLSDKQFGFGDGKFKRAWKKYMILVCISGVYRMLRVEVIRWSNLPLLLSKGSLERMRAKWDIPNSNNIEMLDQKLNRETPLHFKLRIYPVRRIVKRLRVDVGGHEFDLPSPELRHFVVQHYQN